jgi:Flp pilus assembly protein TadD
MRAGRGGEALALFQQAVTLDPRNAEARLDLAAALGKSGRSADAIPHFEKAIEIGGRSTAALNGLGVARLESGDPQGAASAFRDSLALDPKQPGVVELLRRASGGRR